MPIVAAAVCPSPPLLVPRLAAGAAGELDGLRAGCDAAVARLWAADAQVVGVVGVGVGTGEVPAPHGGSFAPWGVTVTVGEQSGSPLPLGPLLGLWLLARQEHTGPVRVWTVAPDATPADCAALGAEIAAAGPALALLVVGDGAACHGQKAPGYDDSRAPGYDAGVLAALRAGDPDGLAALDPDLSAQLKAAGRAPWQVLAGAAAGRLWRAEASYANPYGVGYFVASWT